MIYTSLLLRDMRKYFQIITLFILLVLTLSGCTTSNEKSVDEVDTTPARKCLTSNRRLDQDERFEPQIVQTNESETVLENIKAGNSFTSGELNDLSYGYWVSGLNEEAYVVVDLCNSNTGESLLTVELNERYGLLEVPMPAQSGAGNHIRFAKSSGSSKVIDELTQGGDYLLAVFAKEYEGGWKWVGSREFTVIN